MTRNTVATHASHAFRDSMRNIYNLQRSQVMQHVSKLLNKVNVNPENGKYYYLPPENSKFAGNLERYLPRRMFDNKLKDHGLYDLYYEFRKSDLHEKNMELGILTKNLTNSDYHNLLQSHSQRQLDSVSKRKECKFRKKVAFNRKFGLKLFSKDLHSSDTSPVRGGGMIRKSDHLCRISSDTQHSPTVRPHITKVTCSTQTLLPNLDNEKALESKIRDLEMLNQKWEFDKKNSETKLVKSDQKILDLENQLLDKISEYREQKIDFEAKLKEFEQSYSDLSIKMQAKVLDIRSLNEELDNLKLKNLDLENKISKSKEENAALVSQQETLKNGWYRERSEWNEMISKVQRVIGETDKMLIRILKQCREWLTKWDDGEIQPEKNVLMLANTNVKGIINTIYHYVKDIMDSVDMSNDVDWEEMFRSIGFEVPNINSRSMVDAPDTSSVIHSLGGLSRVVSESPP